MNITKYLKQQVPFTGNFLTRPPEVREVKGQATLQQLTSQLAIVEAALAQLEALHESLTDSLETFNVTDPVSEMDEINAAIEDARNEQD